MQFVKKVENDEKSRYWDLFEMKSFNEMVKIV